MSLSLYEQDYQLWLAKTIAFLKMGELKQLDREHLIEELEDLGRSEKRAAFSYLMRLCEHLLKLKYWEQEREQCFRHWRREIVNFRLQIQFILDNSPSLRNHLQEQFAAAYQAGRELFLAASGFNEQHIPQEPEFTFDQALDKHWLPWQL
ncbi:MAG: DUF29 domain-containing protein [Gloeomargarita sp. SKYB31]|nr:DUF29 domain-containing protein [Gloeomargarita sp. SKYB31]